MDFDSSDFLSDDQAWTIVSRKARSQRLTMSFDSESELTKSDESPVKRLSRSLSHIPNRIRRRRNKMRDSKIRPGLLLTKNRTGIASKLRADSLTRLLDLNAAIANADMENFNTGIEERKYDDLKKITVDGFRSSSGVSSGSSKSLDSFSESESQPQSDPLSDNQEDENEMSAENSMSLSLGSTYVSSEGSPRATVPFAASSPLSSGSKNVDLLVNIEDCPFTTRRDFCDSECQFYHSDPVGGTEIQRQPDPITEPSNQARRNFANFSSKISPMLNHWPESPYVKDYVNFNNMIKSVMSDGPQYARSRSNHRNPISSSLDSLLARKNLTSIKNTMDFRSLQNLILDAKAIQRSSSVECSPKSRAPEGIYTENGLLDADMVFPCSRQSPCLIDSMMIQEHHENLAKLTLKPKIYLEEMLSRVQVLLDPASREKPGIL